MELSSLETKLFKEILNAELDVPVRATLKYENNSLEMIVVPEITPSGHFRLKYYNAPAADPECNPIEGGTLAAGVSASRGSGASGGISTSAGAYRRAPSSTRVASILGIIGGDGGSQGGAVRLDELNRVQTC